MFARYAGIGVGHHAQYHSPVSPDQNMYDTEHSDYTSNDYSREEAPTGTDEDPEESNCESDGEDMEDSEAEDDETDSSEDSRSTSDEDEGEDVDNSPAFEF